jgi:hypothetical protein
VGIAAGFSRSFVVLSFFTMLESTFFFLVFLEAMRIKYRINEYHYQEFYKNLVRKKLSDFLLEEERRCRAKVKRNALRQQATTNANTTALALDSADDQ